MRVAKALKIGVIALEIFQMTRFGGQIAVTPGEIAVDGVAGDSLADDIDGLEAHALERIDTVFTDHRSELLDVVTHASDQLATVARAGTPANPVRFEQHHREAPFGQFDGRVESGEATADDADI